MIAAGEHATSQQAVHGTTNETLPLASDTVPQVDGSADADMLTQPDTPAEVVKQPAESAAARTADTEQTEGMVTGRVTASLAVGSAAAAQPVAMQVDEKQPARGMLQLPLQGTEQDAGDPHQAAHDTPQEPLTEEHAAGRSADVAQQADGSPAKAEAASQQAAQAVDAQPDTEPSSWHWQLPAGLCSSSSSATAPESQAAWPAQEHLSEGFPADEQEDRGPYVACACCLRRWHVSCLPAELQVCALVCWHFRQLAAWGFAHGPCSTLVCAMRELHACSDLVLSKTSKSLCTQQLRKHL